MIGRVTDGPERFLSSSTAPESIVTYFRRANARERLAHAYLFTGPRGSGRRAFALELARALVCETGEPCGHCPSCSAVLDGNHGSVTLFAARERGASLDIDSVRALSQKSRHRHWGPTVWIVENAERLPRPAANALLKTLEEPSAGTLLILIALSRGSLLPTLVSRSHGIQFPWVDAKGGAEEDSAVDASALVGSDFLARNDPKEWLTAAVSEASSPRDALGQLLDSIISTEREALGIDPNGVETIDRDPLFRLEALISLRRDLDGNVNVDLILEALLRELRCSAR